MGLTTIKVYDCQVALVRGMKTRALVWAFLFKTLRGAPKSC